MVDYITPERIANAIQMLYNYNGSHLIVEGQRDNLLFSKFIDQQNCKITIALGRPKVIEVIKILNSRGFVGALGVIDSDFNYILKDHTPIQNLLETDYHDVEVGIVESPVFDLIINYHGHKEKIKKFTSRHPDIKSHFFSLSRPIGILKLANHIYDLGLSFKPEKPEGKTLPYSDFIDKDTMEFLGDKELLRCIINYSRNRNANIKSDQIISEAYEVLLVNDYDLRHLCNGHHLTSIIQLSLRRAIGSTNSNQLTQKMLEEQLIMSYDSKYFQTTTLYSNIKLWEKTFSKIVLNF